MATTGATVAAAMTAKARREVCEHFEQANAFEPADAVAYDPPGPMHRSQFDSLVGRGIVKITADGRYWFDREAERAEQERQRAASVLVLKIVLVVLAILVAVVAISSAMH